MFNVFSSFELLSSDLYKFTKFYYRCCNLFKFYNLIVPSGVIYFTFDLLLDLNSKELFRYSSASFLERERLYLGIGRPGPALIIISFFFK